MGRTIVEPVQDPDREGQLVELDAEMRFERRGQGLAVQAGRLFPAAGA